MCFRSGLPLTIALRAPRHFAGLERFSTVITSRAPPKNIALIGSALGTTLVHRIFQRRERRRPSPPEGPAPEQPWPLVRFFVSRYPQRYPSETNARAVFTKPLISWRARRDSNS
jgi:hypothetical protein